MPDATWQSQQMHTIPELLERRLESAPDAPYLDVCGSEFSARDVDLASRRIAAALHEMGIRPGDRVASLLENSPEAMLFWWGTIRAGAVAVPINTAYKGDYLRHQLANSGSRALFVQADLASRAAAVVPELPELGHVVLCGEPEAAVPGAVLHRWDDVLRCAASPPALDFRPSQLGTFIYTGGTTGLSKGCMLSHHYHFSLATQIYACWGATAADVVWTPLPLFHFNAITTAVLGALISGGRAVIYRKFSVSNFWQEINRCGATVTSTLGTMAYLLAKDEDRPEMPRSGAPVANHSLRMITAAPLPVEIDRILKQRFGVQTFSGAYGTTEASLASWQPPGVPNKPNAAGIVNRESFDVRIFDDDDMELPADAEGEIVVRPRRAHVMFEGYCGNPQATVDTSRNWWYHTGDIGRIDSDGYLYFVDRKADYLRRRGENISSYEVERILMGQGELADVAVHAVPSPLTEDDLKITAVRKPGSRVSEADLFRYCIERLPYFALPRYVEFRDELPRSPVGRVLKRTLREEGVTPTSWDADRSGIQYEKR